MPVYEDYTFLEWLFGEPERYGFLVTALLFVPFLGLCGAFVWYLVAAARHGPVEGFYAVARTIRDGVMDVLRISPQRTMAIARLAIQESIRRRVLIVIVVFLIVLLFAAWFLDVKTDHPARLYLSFVLTATSYLILMLALALSTFSLPNDVKNRTIYTVVTKPVRAVEIVLGRIVGFTVIGTAVLAAMCLISYGFVVLGLKHEHRIEAGEVVGTPAPSSIEDGGYALLTDYQAHHQHEVRVGPDGQGETDIQRGHTHLVRRISDGQTVKYEVGPPRGMLQARVPIRGKLRFLDRTGAPVARGINVGNEWEYRSYIEGATLHTAIWTFEGLDSRRFPEGLPLELTIRVFRTHKGLVDKRVTGELWLRSADPSKPLESDKIVFESEEYSTQLISVPRKLSTVEEDGSLRDIDLFDDLAPDGRVEVWLRCAEPNQYFGVAQADVYVRAADASFFLNFVKAYVGIWLQLLVVTCFGVMFSTFLSGGVAMVATLTAVVMGYFSQFVANVQTGEQMGGGPFESLIRMLTQENTQTPLDIGVAEKVVKGVDFVYMLVLRGASSLLPDFASFNTASYVAYGYDVSAGLLASYVLLALTYASVVTVVGFLFLKTREIAA